MPQPAEKRLVTEATVASHVAAQVTTPGTATATALSATIVDTVEGMDLAKPESSSVIIMGDSITNNNTFYGANYSGAGLGLMDGYSTRGHWTWASVWLGHRCRLIQNAGISGQTAQQIAARVPDVIAQQPGIVVLLSGRNSVITNGDNAATIISVVRDQTVKPLLAAGIRVVLGTITPRDGDNASQTAALFGFNNWAKNYARSEPGVFLADFHGAVTTGTDEKWKTGYAYDGLHPNSQGGAAMGRVLANILSFIVPPVDNMLTNNTDPTVLHANGLMLGSTGVVATGAGVSGVAPTSWTFDSATGGTVVGSKVARTDGKPGEWFQMDFQVQSPSSYARLRPQANIIPVVGKTYYLEAEYEADATFVPQLCTPIMYARNGASVGTNSVGELIAATGEPLGDQAKLASGTLRTMPLTIPEGTIAMPFELRVNGLGKFRIGRVNVKEVQTI